MTTTANKNLTSSDTCWMDTQDACFDYLLKNTGDKRGVSAFIGDNLPDNKVNCWAFIVSGGRVQDQNYQCPRPCKSFYADAALLGQYKTMENAMKMAGRVMNSLPAYEDDQNEGAGDIEALKHRGIQPNVATFEMTNHPEIFSRIVNLGDDNNPNLQQYWMDLMQFRVIYTNGKT